MQFLKTTAKHTELSTQAVLGTITEAVAGQLPAVDSMKKTVQRIRQKELMAPARQRRSPKFPIKLWNCYGLIKNDIPRTNNAIEGWHNSFKSILNAVHPSIWKFIDALKKEEKLNRVRIQQFIAGNDPKPKKKENTKIQDQE
ncbi:uncharacterized protein LOC126555422 [Aphis gossypii]|uniref:uncharacterized protein LOC126555422 n=1 Tax=Aphis gossypii TaxID=80765 RepID=UPI0021597278|nr:uncharacterized protein LOC126555422 [Aphis gossypii]